MSDSEFMLLDRDYSRRSRNEFIIRILVIGFAFILGFVIISLIISSNTPALKRPQFVQNCSVDYNYDFSLLTLRWPTSACEDMHSCVKYPTDRWIIHGLWPTFANKSWPEYCCFDRKFDVKNLDPIKGDLLTVWPNLMADEPNDSLWRHEWQRHGTCTKTKQLLYFNSTLSLYKEFPIYEWLKEQNIIPNNNKTYGLNDFLKVLNHKLGHKLQITCSQNKNNNKSQKIEEIRLCIQRNTTDTVIDCPEKSTCAQEFFYPESTQT